VPKCIGIGVLVKQACPRRPASPATNAGRGGQAVFDGSAMVMLELREAVMA